MNESTATWELEPAPESTAHVQLEKSYGNFINGKFVESADGSKFKTTNPADEKVNAEITESTESDVCLLYTSPSPRDATLSRMPSSA